MQGRKGKKEWAFSNGWKALHDDFKPEVKEKIKKTLGMKSDGGFLLRKNGYYPHKPCETAHFFSYFPFYSFTQPKIHQKRRLRPQ